MRVLTFARRATFTAILTGALVSVPSAGASTPDSVTNQIEDYLVSRDVRDLGTYTVAFDNGTVVLEGEAPTLNAIRRIESEVGKIAGILPVQNRLAVTPVSESDAELATRVRSAIRTDPHFNIFDWVSGSVIDGVAYLSGDVREPWDRDGYEYRVADIPGIVRIESTIGDLPLSTDDDRIRVLAARAVYGDSSFWKYANRAHAPIHIIVRNGSIRLEGMVLNAMERQLVEDRVRHGVIGFALTNNLEVES